MNGSQTGWSWFDRCAQGGSDQGTNQDEGTSDCSDPDRALRVAYARCFGTPDGEKVLKHLRTVTLERTLGPDATAHMLRHLEGQRQLVSAIAAWVQRGHQPH